ncbi:hypothetical protein ABI_00310 [Asticcacaulis biprosthecium C19]|uniref:Uncharacterized protein n=1 Tax=Asticcacaulis biprosthecium C19 TaxID=715226 RepID=F4QFY8_9CAUL|nr:hypothetical protein ABI_00310 [Asticcacaulis biprosthecium C19]
MIARIQGMSNPWTSLRKEFCSALRRTLNIPRGSAHGLDLI